MGAGTSTTSNVVEVVVVAGTETAVVDVLEHGVTSTVVGGLSKSANVRSGPSEPLPEHADKIRMRTRSFRITFTDPFVLYGSTEVALGDFQSPGATRAPGLQALHAGSNRAMDRRDS